MQGRLTVTEGRRYPLTVGFGKRDLARTVGFGKRDLARTVGFRKRDFENGILKNEIRKTGLGNGIRPEQSDSKNGIRTTHAPAVLSVGRAGGRAGPAGQGPNKEYKIRKNKTYKTSHWPKVTGTHGGLHSRQRASVCL